MSDNKNREFVRTLHSMIADFLRDNPDIDRSYYQEIWDWLEKKESEENEDEIHRKWILEYLYDGLRKADEQFKDHFKSAIDWLEKQKDQRNYRKLYEDIAKSEWFKKAYEGKSLGGEDEQKEQKPINWTELNGKDIAKLEVLINNVHNEYPNGIGQESFGEEVLERFREYKEDEELDGKEQNPITKFKVGDKVHFKGDDVNILTITGLREDAYCTDSAYGPILFSDQDEWEIVEQRSVEWSEKDEECRKELIQYIEQRIGDDTTGQYLWRKWRSWLIFLPERFNLQPNQEWSEEEIVNWLKENFYVSSFDNTKIVTKFSSMDDLIKSFHKRFESLLSRPKPSGNWKPSKYMLSLVKKVADGEMLTGVEQMAMGTLHEELKKLSI